MKKILFFLLLLSPSLGFSEEVVYIDNLAEQQCDSRVDFIISVDAIIERQDSLEAEYNALLQSGLEGTCPNRYYILQHSELGSSIRSTLNAPGSSRTIQAENKKNKKEVYAPEYSCVNHICAHEDICATPNWEEQTGFSLFGYFKQRHNRIKEFTGSCFW